jgi:hypothetical protein
VSGIDADADVSSELFYFTTGGAGGADAPPARASVA